MRIRREAFPVVKIGIVGVMILMIASIAVPGLLRAGNAEREASTIGTMKTVHLACMEYYLSYGQYPSALSDLQKSPNGGLSSTAADLIDSSLASGIKNGYRYTYERGHDAARYSITAAPTKLHPSEARFFFVDQTGVIRFAIGVASSALGTPLN